MTESASPDSSPDPTQSHRETSALIAAIFIAGLCSIVYELLISTASSYFLGDSVKQFSITIGLYMLSLGLGALFSRSIRDRLIPRFIAMEVALALLGGISVPALYLVYAVAPDAYPAAMVLLTLAIGTLIGFEIPLLTRILEGYYSLRINISNVLAVDYLGALVATLLFPFVLLPFLGTFRSSLLFGLVNLGIAALMIACFGTSIGRRKTGLVIATITAATILGGSLLASGWLIQTWSQSLYDDTVILSRQSPYQRIVLTRHKNDLRLFLDGNLQFSSRDEYRYHEALVHIPAGLISDLHRVLILGGGDGLGVREVLKYDTVREITLVDLDPAVTAIATGNPLLRAINADSLTAPRVTVIHQDAFRWLTRNTTRYDLIICDLPDPNNTSLARLYTREFFKLTARSLAPDGILVTQATSPFYAPAAFWSIAETLRASPLSHILPYHVNVPAFGEWGFIAAARHPLDPNAVNILDDTRYLTPQIARHAFTFPPDMVHPGDDVAVNTLDHPRLLQTYLKATRSWR